MTAPEPTVGWVFLAMLWMLPIVLLMMTSFVKISVVLAILRNAIGAVEIPPTLVMLGLSLVLTAHVMAPTAKAVAEAAAPLLSVSRPTPMLMEGAVKALQPMNEFLIRHSKASDRKMFLDLGTRLATTQGATSPAENSLGVLVPAFVVGEIGEAFRIGVLVFLPFLVVDLVVSVILMTLGLTAISPAAITIPLKLLLFVLADGWRLLSRSLITGYL